MLAVFIIFFLVLLIPLFVQIFVQKNIIHKKNQHKLIEMETKKMTINLLGSVDFIYHYEILKFYLKL